MRSDAKEQAVNNSKEAGAINFMSAHG